VRRWTAILTGVLVVGLWSATTLAQPRPGGDMGEMDPWAAESPIMLRTLLRAVALTESQQVQVRQILANHRPPLQRLRGQLRVAQEQLADRLYAPGPAKPEDLAPLTQQIGQLREQLGREALQTALEIRAVLTAEQLAKAAQIRQRLAQLRSEMRSLLRSEP
jgi:Spy/CpxP family protein refolding chaperone